jgi:phospholipid/cholesterol/gamma-HCH transport system substrate-binding protein
MIDSDKKTEMLVGLFLFVGLLLLGGSFSMFGRVREVFKDTYHLQVPFRTPPASRKAHPSSSAARAWARWTKNPRTQ